MDLGELNVQWHWVMSDTEEGITTTAQDADGSMTAIGQDGIAVIEPTGDVTLADGPTTELVRARRRLVLD